MYNILNMIIFTDSDGLQKDYYVDGNAKKRIFSIYLISINNYATI